jgi:fructan beta-fructosidase
MQKILLLFILFFIGAHSNAQPLAYNEKHRPQFHFSPPAHWMNDPNGMVYYKGEYHLFYQYYPDSTVWGPMHWGHAVTKDLIHWQHLPVALYPDPLGYIFSGSVVVDKNNTSGFQSGDESPLVAIFTYHNMNGEKKGRNDFQTQGIAFSSDKGRSWHKYANNPVIKNPGIKDFRDPKVMYHEASEQWILTMAVANKVQFYSSPDLKKWKLAGEFGVHDGNHGGVWECPDLFPLSSKDGKSKKWVLLVSVGSGTQYFIGDFNGKTFTNSNPPQTTLWLDYGCDNYAGVTWSNSPGSRHLFLGWMSNWQYAQKVPTEKWRSAMTLPRELSLNKITAGYRVVTKPARECELLRTKSDPVNFLSQKEHRYSLGELVVDFDITRSDDFGIELRNSVNESLRIGYNRSNNQFYINRTNCKDKSFSKEFPAVHTAPRTAKGKQLKMHLYIDRSSVELFADDGSVVMTDIFFPAEDFSLIGAYAKNGGSAVTGGKLYKLQSAWH